MKTDSLKKYRPFAQELTAPRLTDRRWPDTQITRAPVWASVDLRDGNQALAIPMNVEEKLRFFDTLCKIGFPHIEVGFPSASDTEFRFVRYLIEQNLVPENVHVQVLTQAREHLIDRTFEALKGAKQAIPHLYNATAPVFRNVVFNMSREQVVQMARERAAQFMALAKKQPETQWTFQYSPETFAFTEPQFAYEVCRAVLEQWESMLVASDEPINRRVILNLPETVEMTTPNVHADQIEWFCRELEKDGLRNMVQVSLHTHNDRGTGVAATELGLMAGADRVEGALFGNGERTGNLDIVNVALNMNAHGVDSGLDFSNLPEIRRIYEECTRMSVHERHPYAGELAFTAFSGSHQDAIKKGFDAWRKDESADKQWQMPYLTVDPQDIGRTYEAIIRINSQSGKGGVAYVLNEEYGLDLPKSMHPEVGAAVNSVADLLGKELSGEEIQGVFVKEFVNRTGPLALIDHDESHEEAPDAAGKLVSRRAKHGSELGWTFSCSFGDRNFVAEGFGNGPINALVNALDAENIKDFQVTDYRSHAISKGSAADAAAFVQIKRNADGKTFWGCGIHPSIEQAGMLALVSAVNRHHNAA